MADHGSPPAHAPDLGDDIGIRGLSCYNDSTMGEQTVSIDRIAVTEGASSTCSARSVESRRLQEGGERLRLGLCGVGMIGRAHALPQHGRA